MDVDVDDVQRLIYINLCIVPFLEQIVSMASGLESNI